MKKQIKILMLAIMLIMVCMLPVNAANATATLNASKTGLYPGETFTVTFSAESTTELEGIDSNLIYDKDKLEFIEAEEANSNWNVMDTDLSDVTSNNYDRNIAVYCEEAKTSDDIFVMTFKVKETAPVNTTAEISLNGIVLYDANNQSYSIGTKEVEISILDRLEVNITEYEQEQQGTSKFIHKINPKTFIQTIIGKIKTNGVIEIFKDNAPIIVTNDKKIGTGMEIRITLNDEVVSYKTIIKGDTDGDGDATFRDILQINRHRLSKESLTNVYLKAADVTGEGSVDFRDILKVNKYRLGIDSL